MNLVITGEVGSGKTTWCRKYTAKLTSSGFSVGGVLCPAAYDENGRTGYDILDLRTGMQVPLGTRDLTQVRLGERVGNYILFTSGLDFARQAIAESLQAGSEVIFLDEIGPLELSGGGLAEMAKRAHKEAPNTISVVRKSIVTEFMKKFGKSTTQFFEYEINPNPGNSGEEVIMDQFATL